MPIALTDDRAAEVKYLIIAGVSAIRYEGMQRYLILFLRGDFTLEEANAFVSAAFDDIEIPRAADYFRQDMEVVQSMGISVDAGLPEKLQHFVDNYSMIEYIDCYAWHLMWHYVREYRMQQDHSHGSGESSDGDASRVDLRNATGSAGTSDGDASRADLTTAAAASPTP